MQKNLLSDNQHTIHRVFNNRFWLRRTKTVYDLLNSWVETFFKFVLNESSTPADDAFCLRI
ncbi:MAG: hypothetical protein COT74_05945 [Bdellovibrionales bacterium CG10_big_fil_rev_8_21_14_0_10_45_34]|nr:MAG: hypothetical protein COT74_05945 [Bdellovibrionales bacterium CG10_big_fil_rev_8_21_14_0_10_45_34]